MTLTKASAIQLTDQANQVSWSADPDSVLGYSLTRNVNAGGDDFIASVAGDARTFFDPFTAAVGDSIVYAVTDLDGGAPVPAPAITIRDLDDAFTYGLIDPLADDIRYTTLPIVKRRLGVPTADVDRDEDITDAIIAAEVQIDQMNGRSFPDTGANPQIAGVPRPIKQWSTDASVAFYKRADAAFGTAGSEAWVGTLDARDDVERILRRRPSLAGYQVGFGVG